MTRYTINIGNDFPLGDDEPGGGNGQDPGGWGRRKGPRFLMLLRVFFVLALAAIVLSHPVKTALVLGAVLLVRRSRWFGELRSRLRGFDWRSWDWRTMDWRDVEKTAFGVWNRAAEGRCGARRARREDRQDRDYGAFV